ncbi:hypothetical protein K458DRAFT_394289 [Lentithecium fluviatile CBS 122367]|uniref:Ribosome assembly protein 3 n=1 Tax=Lentithecium fluviatile CBS 122367 TaxID=1168545 RepID=A0A6G1IMC8_9PLEO|nr:hypothetical protein K458DRAFT_394289 [Lentithecium fluviatile CBS 122367]
MATPKSNSSEKVKKPRKKVKSRTVIAVSSSESDSDDSKPRSKKARGVSEEHASTTLPESAKSKKAKPSKAAQAQENDGDMQMTEADSTPILAPAVSKVQSKPSPKDAEGFDAIYLRKVTAELADDLDRAREAKDFKSSSLPMLIHALKQGASMYSAEEKMRVVGAAGS